MNLSHAAEHLDITLAKKLINDGADINASDDFGQTPLHIAIDSVFEEVLYIYDTEKRIVQPKMDFIKILVLNGADLNKPDNKGRTPIDWAIRRNNEAFTSKLKELSNNKIRT